MIRVLPNPGPLTPRELMTLTPKEAALLESWRRLFEVMPNAGSSIPQADWHVYVDAMGLYLELRHDEIQRSADKR